MKSSITTLTLALGLIASGTTAAAYARAATQPTQQAGQSSIISEQVKSDLADWRRAGFDAHTYDVLSYDVFSAAYQQRYAKYQELRKLHTSQTAKN